jgi:lysophospholipase L1-like esterase
VTARPLAVALLAGALLAPVAGPALVSAAAPRRVTVVQLGDSIASGEGTLYGYGYDRATGRWTGGNVFASWPGPYPECHDSPAAYGNLVARRLGARFVTFACSGASYLNGVVAPQTSSGSLGAGAALSATLRPAQFGVWPAGPDLNAAYDAARPDLVLITLGADDVEFSPVVRDCVENELAHGFGVESLRCTAANPGPTITADITANLPALGPHLVALARAIRDRGHAAGRVPAVVFTLYHDPFPAGAQRCPDVALLDPAQVAYLRSLLGTLNASIRSALAHQPGVAVADTSHAMTGPDGHDHRWCSADPWAYGLSIISLSDPSSLLSSAPFHPTPAGQARFAALVTPVARKALGR